MDAVQPTVGDRAGIRHGKPPRARAPADDVRRPVPDDARPQLGELVRGVAAGEHVEHVLELHAREVAEGIGAADEVVDLVDGQLVLGADRHDLLREHVERIARDHGLLDRALLHPSRDHGRLQQVGPELREDAALGDGAELVAGAADPLQPAGHRLRALDLDHEVDRAHVDAQLERRGGDEAGNPSALQQLLDLDPLLAREGAVVGAGDLLFGQLVEPEREPLGEAAVVDEEDRRAVPAHEAQQLGIDRGPDRLRVALGAGVHLLAVRGRGVRQRAGGGQLAHVLDGDDHLEVELLRSARVDELDLAVAGDEAADLVQRALRGGERDPLHRVAGQAVEPLDGEHQVRAALGRGDGVHLVEDQRADRAQHLARLRGEDEVERLGGRDQDVGRVPLHRGALALRRVAGADADPEVGLQARERPAQVALDVVVERLQRRDVEQPHACRGGLGAEAVDPVEEGGEGLARARRRLDQRVAAGGDRRPAQRLRGRRPGECAAEPGPRLRAEDRERIHPASLAPGTGVRPRAVSWPAVSDS